MTPVELRDVAIRAARAGAGALAPFLSGRVPLDVKGKAAHDFVTAADVASERAVSAAIREAFPGHAILGEEEERADLHTPGPLWIIDPLDGTTNFIHGFPAFCVSVGCVQDGRVLAGAVLDPTRDELFAAARGAGSTLNGAAIRVTGRGTLADALIGTGFPFRQHQHVERYLDALRAVMAEVAGVRRAGSAALDLCYVACGRFDGFWEEALKPWDVAAGSLIIEEAGGVVTDFAGGDTWLERGNIVTGTPAVAAELRALVHRHMG